MAMSVGRRRNGAIAEINVTPMADVMIVLLIIFMVATPLIVRPLRLPDAEHAAEYRGERIEILLRGDGSLVVDGSPVPLEALGEWLAGRSGASSRATLLVQADRDAPYEAVARVLAACRTAGVVEIGLAAQRRVGSGRRGPEVGP